MFSTNLVSKTRFSIEIIINHGQLQKLIVLTRECKYQLGLQYRASHQFQDPQRDVFQQHSMCQLLPWTVTNIKMPFIDVVQFNLSLNVTLHNQVSSTPHFLCVYVLSSQSFRFSSSVSCLVALTRCIWITNIKSRLMVSGDKNNHLNS